MPAPRQGLRLPRRPHVRRPQGTGSSSRSMLPPVAGPPAPKPPDPTYGVAGSGKPQDLTQPLPPDPIYDQQVGAYGRRRDTTIAGYNQQRTAGLLDYGYNASYDANGNPTGIEFDPTNVFSRAAQLRKRYLEAQKGNINGMAAAGQLRSGAALRAAGAIDYGNSLANDQLQKSALAFLARINRGISGAQNDYEENMATAGAGRIARAPDNPLYTPTDVKVYTNKDAGYGSLAPGYGIQNGKFVKLVNGQWVLA